MKALFIDRDGTLIEEYPGYRKYPDEVRLIDGIVDVLREWTRAGYFIVIITNQSGIRRGIITEDQFWEVQLRLYSFLEQDPDVMFRLLDTFVCPHLPDTCECRKPKPGLLIWARNTYGIDLSQSVMVGDRETDVNAGINAGVGATHLFTNACSFMEFTKGYLEI